MGPRVGLDAADNRLDEYAWREVLARPFLAFAGGLFEQPFESRRLDVDIERSPLYLVNDAKDLFQVHGIVEA